MSEFANHVEVDVLDRFASGVLDEQSKRSTETHLASCASCRTQLEELQRNLELASALRAVAPPSDPPPSSIPESFGAYRIVREIGRGGMGVVFEATQSNPHRRVALKLLGAGYSTGPEVERMLRREAQALARLEHPGVARIYDVGRLEDGRPYLAMELVDGLTLTRYVSEQSLSRGARLRLFAELCGAIAYAHRRGVIHRDLKPSNVLVDRDGQPRVLDFGLARVLAVEGEASLSLSVDLGRIRGTLPYMSPEQARGDELAVDARSDLYSLGVILYQLLVEHLPYDLPSGNLPEAARVICEQAPRRPASIDRSLRGDLETIVLRALAKQPEERYETVAALRDDVQRFLDSQPIAARPPSLVYQLGKLVQRHKLFFSGVALIFIAAIVVGVRMSALYREAESQRALASGTAEEKRIEAARAQNMVELLERMLGSANLHEAKGPDYTVRALLDEFSNGLGDRLRDQPAVEASLRTTIGRAYRSLGLPAQALPHFESALAFERDRAQPNAETEADLLEHRGWCFHDQARYDDAERDFRDVLERRTRLHGPVHFAVAKAQFNLGDVLRHRGDTTGAEEMARASLATWESVGPGTSSERPEPMNLLGQLLEARGDLAGAREVLQRALDESVQLLGDHNPTTASVINNLGRACAAQGDHVAAGELYERALAIRRELTHGDHPDIALLLNNLGNLRRQQGHATDAVRLLRDGLEMRRRLDPAPQPATAQTLNNLALALYDTGAIDEAVQTMRESVEMRRQVSNEDDPELPNALVNLASMLRGKREHAAALTLCKQALALQEARLPPDHIDVAFTLLAIGRTQREMADFEAAETNLRRALEIRTAALGERSLQVAECQANLGMNLRRKGDAAGAEAVLRRSVETYVAMAGDDHPNTCVARRELARCLLALGRNDDAEALFLSVHQAYERRYGTAHASTQASARELAEFYASIGRGEQAEQWRASAAR